jgi:hypothetical protein
MSMGMRVGTVMFMAMVFARTVRVLVGMLVVVAVAVVMTVAMSVFVVFRTNAHRILSGQSASAFFTH